MSKSKKIEAFINKKETYGLKSTNLEQTHKKIIERNQRRNIQNISTNSRSPFNPPIDKKIQPNKLLTANMPEQKSIYSMQLPNRKMSIQNFGKNPRSQNWSPDNK